MSQLAIFSASIVTFSVNLYFLGLIWFADKHDKQVRSLIVMGVATCYWTIFDAIVMIAEPYSYAFIYMLRSIMLIIAPYCFFSYVARLNGFKWIDTRRATVILTCLVASDCVLLLTNNLHRLVFSKDGIPLPEYGPLFGYHAGLAYVGIALSVVLLVRYIVKQKPPLLYSASWILCCAIPIFVNVLFTFGIIDMQQDIAPFGFAVMFILFSLYFYRTRLSQFKASALGDVFETMREAILLVDTKGIITDNNPAFGVFFPDFPLTVGRTKLAEFASHLRNPDSLDRITDKVADTALDMLVDPNAEMERVQLSMRHGEPRDDEDGTDGQIRTFTVTKQKVFSRSRRASGQLIILSDVSEFLDMVREADEASNAKTAFLAHMSHEMRTPLNAILGIGEMALRKAPADGELHSDLEKIHDSGKNLLSVINDILDISKIEAGHLEMVESDYEIASLINDAVSQNIVRIGSKPINFRLTVDPSLPKSLKGDALRVQQILNNFLSNAIKYTQEGEVCLSVLEDGGIPPEGSVLLRFEVSDTGQGIREKDIASIFSDYRQVNEQKNKGIEGTGLGLSITRQLAEQMGGGVTVESEFGKGSVFTAVIRQGKSGDDVLGADGAAALEGFRYRAEKPDDAKHREIVPVPGLKVLVVDDVEINLIVAGEMLKMFGIEPDFASSGRESVELVRAGEPKYDLILMDHQMPDVDGVEAVRIIRTKIGTEYAKTVPIVALTANAIIGSERQYYESGFDGVLTKPIDTGRLSEILERYRPKEQGE